MVRRWSRINEFNFSLKNKKLFFFKKSSKSRMFKLTVSTRKFFKKYTKFRRKAFNRLRHRSNWLVYSNVLKFWSCDYLNTKTFSKKTWFINSQKFNFIIFNWSSVKNLNNELFFNLNYNILNLNALFFKNKCNYSKFFFFWADFNNVSIGLTDTHELTLNDINPLPVLSYFENYFYENDCNEFLKNENTYFLFFNNIENSVNQQFLNYYKFFIYLTILDLNFLN